MPEPRTKFYQEKARSAAVAAKQAERMGNLEIAAALREIETIWLKLAGQTETFEQETPI
jgi:hypothetical protein